MVSLFNLILNAANIFFCPDGIRSLFINEKWMRLDILSSKPYPIVIQGFVKYLIKDNALNELCEVISYGEKIF